MRMWCVNPIWMCRKHLLGEHLELHIIVDCVKANQKIDGFLVNGLIEINSIVKRHSEIVNEMLSRGYQHKTPLEFDWRRYKFKNLGFIDRLQNIRVLTTRCKECNKGYEKLYHIRSVSV